MPRYAAFLRGINVGGRRITNDELRAACEKVGLSEVGTFRASGNVIFDAPPGDAPDELSERIEEGLGRILGYEVPVFLRGEDEVHAIARHEPFPADVVRASGGKLQVSLLPAKPSAALRRRILAMATDEDRLGFADRELYWLPSGGMMDTTLDLDAIEAAVGPSTRRTKGTLEQIAAKFFDGD
jgi:uncharacterized protein (DUF1697 family)